MVIERNHEVGLRLIKQVTEVSAGSRIKSW